MNYNPQMEYRRCGKAGWTISAVSMGGHWKRLNTVIPGLFSGDDWLSADLDDPRFQKNRYDVVTRCIERGINYVDACTGAEIKAYSRALAGRRDQMYLGWSWYEREARQRQQCHGRALMDVLEDSLRVCRQEYVDLYRVVCGVEGHRDASGRWIYYTAGTALLPTSGTGFLAAVERCDCGFFGIKPFAGTSLFNGDGSPGNEHEPADNRLARLAIRNILANPAITASVPGLATEAQVDNVAQAVLEPRELDVQEQTLLRSRMDRVWATLAPKSNWLKNWEHI